MSKLFAVSMVAVLVCFSSAEAQVAWDADYANYFISFSSIDMALQWDGNPVVPTVTQGTNGVNMTYDATVLPVYPPSDPNGTIAWSLDGTGYFHVGPVPVQATLSLQVNGKLVNGGGDADHPSTNLGWSTAIYYDLNEDHYVNAGEMSVPEFELESNTSLVGNGLIVVDDMQTMSSSFILAPEYSYILLYSQTWSISDLPSGPMASTFEAGGETSYSGITLTLEATMVPEPATLLLLSLGGLAVLRHRRRST